MHNIFHIGYHKTATTWFQQSLYPLVKNIDFIEREKIRFYFYENEDVNFPNNAVNVFCDEELSGNIHNGGLSGFLPNNVALQIAKFKNPRVIIFIRNQYDMIQSSYLQYIKAGGNYSIEKYLYHRMYVRSNRTALFSFKHFNYYNLIQQYQNLIGKENVYVYLFEDFVNDKKHFIKRFVNIHQFDIDVNNIDFSSSNKSHSLLSYYLARFFNSFSRKNVLFKYHIIHIPKIYEYSRAILSKFTFFPIKKQSFLNDKIKSSIYEYYKNANQKLAQELGLELKKYNYPI